MVGDSVVEERKPHCPMHGKAATCVKVLKVHSEHYETQDVPAFSASGRVQRRRLVPEMADYECTVTGKRWTNPTPR